MKNKLAWVGMLAVAVTTVGLPGGTAGADEVVCDAEEYGVSVGDGPGVGDAPPFPFYRHFTQGQCWNGFLAGPEDQDLFRGVFLEPPFTLHVRIDGCADYYVSMEWDSEGNAEGWQVCDADRYYWSDEAESVLFGLRNGFGEYKFEVV